MMSIEAARARYNRAYSQYMATDVMDAGWDAAWQRMSRAYATLLRLLGSA